MNAYEELGWMTPRACSQLNFRRSTLGRGIRISSEQPSDTRTLAATVEEGTARKPVDVNAEALPGGIPIAGTK
jgi:hypothetical protein